MMGEQHTTRDLTVLATLGGGLSKTGYAAAPVAIIGGLAANDVAAIGGLIVAVVGVVTGRGIEWYYRHQEHKRAEREFAARERRFASDRRVGMPDGRTDPVERRGDWR